MLLFALSSALSTWMHSTHWQPPAVSVPLNKLGNVYLAHLHVDWCGSQNHGPSNMSLS